MKRYAIIHLPIGSFFSKALYRDVGREWKGTGFGYLLLLLAVCWIFPMYQMQTGLSRFVDREAPKVVSQIPDITIIDGKASIREPQPYWIEDPDTHRALAVIDTTGAITSLESAGAAVLVTATEVLLKKSEVETRSYRFDEIQEFTLTQGRITGWLNTLKKTAVPFLYPLFLLGSFIYRIIQLLIYAAIARLFASWCKSKLSYGALLRLSAAAITPCILVKTILSANGVHFPFAKLWYFLAAMGYLFFGVKASAQPAEPAAPATQP